MRVLALLVAGLAALGAVSASSWKDCGSTLLKPTSVTLSPDPPQRNTQENVILGGQLSEQATGGTVDLSISFAGFTVYNNTWPVCNLVKCPVGPGPITAQLQVPGSAIPSISPAGTYNAQATITDQSGTQVTCVAVQFALS